MISCFKSADRLTMKMTVGLAICRHQWPWQALSQKSGADEWKPPWNLEWVQDRLGHFWFSSLAYRELGSHHFFPHNMRKAEQTKNQLFLNPSENWNHRGADPKTGETGEYAESRVTRSRNCHWRQQLVGQFKDYVTNCWRLTLDWLERKIPGCSLTPRYPTRL